MAAAFNKNKSKIQAVLEDNLIVVVPKLHSVGLISDEDRDRALNSTIDSCTRAHILTNTIESKIVNYRKWWILVYVLLSSGIDAEQSFFENLVVLPTYYSVARQGGQRSPSGLGDSATTYTSLSLMQEKEFTVKEEKAGGLKETPSSSKDEATGSSPMESTPSGATNLSESEPERTRESTVHSPNSGEMQSSVWYTHARKYPGIKFSNYYTRQTVTYRGGIIKGEGIELQIPGHAIKQEESVEFIIQGVYRWPF